MPHGSRVNPGRLGLMSWDMARALPALAVTKPGFFTQTAGVANNHLQLQLPWGSEASGLHGHQNSLTHNLTHIHNENKNKSWKVEEVWGPPAVLTPRRPWGWGSLGEAG